MKSKALSLIVMALRWAASTKRAIASLFPSVALQFFGKDRHTLGAGLNAH